MRILKLLNRLNFSIIFFIVLLCISTKAEDNPADIWNIDKKETEKKTSEDSQILDHRNNYDPAVSLEMQVSLPLFSSSIALV